MKFTLKQMIYVEAAGRLGSIAQAARELSISQSSITAAIDALEASLEYNLFLRTPAKGIQATPAGAQALLMIRGFIHQARHFETDLQSLGQGALGLVRIACYATAAPAFLPPILQNITEHFPQMSVQVLEGNLTRILQFLGDGQADLVFTYKASLGRSHAFTPLFSAPPYALIHSDDALANQNSVTFAELEKQPMVMLDLPQAQEYYSGMFAERGLSPTIAHSTRSAEIARALVAGGFGYTLLNIRPPDYVEGRVGYRAVPISDAPPPEPFGIATMQGTQQPKIVQSFIQSCLELKAKRAFDGLTVW